MSVRPGWYAKCTCHCLVKCTEHLKVVWQTKPRIIATHRGSQVKVIITNKKLPAECARYIFVVAIRIITAPQTYHSLTSMRVITKAGNCLRKLVKRARAVRTTEFTIISELGKTVI